LTFLFNAGKQQLNKNNYPKIIIINLKISISYLVGDMRMKFKTISTVTIFLLIMSLTACGGGGGGGGGGEAANNNDTSLLDGYFLDNVVDGLEYATFSKTGENTYTQTRESGLTEHGGRFKYKEGEYIRFYIGNIDFFTMVPVKSIITPYDMAVEQYPERPINIARFLQTIDNDDNLGNGITINESVREHAITYTTFPGFNLGFESGILPIVEELTNLTDAGVRDLVDYGTAERHLNSTFYSANPGNYPFVYGYYTGTYSITVSNCTDPADDGTYNFSVNLSINNQNQADFSGTAIGTISYLGELLNENISFNGSISTSGEISGDTTHAFVDSGGTGTFTGQLNGDTLTISNAGSDTYGDICSYTRNITVER